MIVCRRIREIPKFEGLGLVGWIGEGLLLLGR